MKTISLPLFFNSVLLQNALREEAWYAIKTVIVKLIYFHNSSNAASSLSVALTLSTLRCSCSNTPKPANLPKTASETLWIAKNRKTRIVSRKSVCVHTSLANSSKGFLLACLEISSPFSLV